MARTSQVQAAVAKMTVELLIAMAPAVLSANITPRYAVDTAQEIAELFHDRLTASINRGEVEVEDLVMADEQFEGVPIALGRAD